ncbi:DUF4238 domain-containing protein [Rhizobium sp. BK376]|uniref:DUF4238 domain-containing protein n=1 Tax=Rhizobium sp. BK376 TaxID=2512149 RepID=UPI00104A7CD7|nr:DUF4238 domain-containing protein [Rhizobium sp. BK376]TCR83875.1 hypothetical protein EV561_10899 [Rhizobium sp. BK376]
MAGRGQHFIPRHFQKPFVFSETKDQLWMYRRGKDKAIPVARGDAGKEHDFYSSPSAAGDVTLDDLITNYEHKIFPLVDHLRSLPIGSGIEADIASEIVVHFFFRSQYLRKSVSEMWSGLADTMYVLATDPASVVGSNRLPAHRPPAAIASAIHEQVLLNKLDESTGVSSETLVRIIYMGLREQLDQITKDAREAISLAISQFSIGAEKKIRDSHRDILLNSLAPPKRIAQLRELRWEIVAHAESAAILPDCICIAATSEGPWQSLLFVDDDVAMVAMPLTPNALLVGKKTADQTFEVSEFNSLAARSCFEFFLSKEEVALEGILQADLGQVVRTEINKAVSEKILEVIGEYLRAPLSEQALELNKIQKKPATEDSYNIQLMLYDFGDEELAKRLAEAVKEIVLSADLGVAYSVLDGFTFANDYEGAIGSLDRGYEPTQELKSTYSPLGIGVAMPITVKSEGALKTRFILRGFLADAILTDVEDDRRAAVNTVFYLLNGLVLDYLERTRFSGWMLEKLQASIDDYFYARARKIFDIYYCTRRSTLSLDDASMHIEDFQNHLPNILSDCTEKRRSYRVDSDLDGFLTLAFEQVELILAHVARILGAFAGVNGTRSIPPEIDQLLRPYQMNDWLCLFAADLSAFYENLDVWENFEEIFFVNRHFERWLLAVGVIIQDLGNGQFYAHIPLGIDAEYLVQLETAT